MATVVPEFLDWFQAHQGTIDTSSVDVINFLPSEGGRGAVAVKDIPEGHVLFTIPRDLTLSTRTSSLPLRFGMGAWKNAKLHEGWAGLILCMMWEAAQGSSSKWSGYFDILPTSFDTPMFWTEGELAELRGTSVVEKLGRADAEKDYKEKLIPAINSRPELFLPRDIHMRYSVEMYHVMGSRILSRSFNVEKWAPDEEEVGDGAGDVSMGSGMDVDLPDGAPAPPTHSSHGTDDLEHEGGEEEEQEDSSDIAMVPMADILNARYGSENAKLFYEENHLKMISTRPIKGGEQIWNTYGDLPNAELLRRYGHVDVIQLPNGGQGNPGDVAEIRADLIVSVAAEQHSLSTDDTHERIDWWLEEGGDDVFDLYFDLEIPPSIISVIRLLLLPDEEWEKIKEKAKPPKPKMDAVALTVLHEVLQRRLKEYPTSIQDDEQLLMTAPSLNLRHAIIVRLGEKKILDGILTKTAAALAMESNTKKRKTTHEDRPAAASTLKKSKRQA